MIGLGTFLCNAFPKEPTYVVAEQNVFERLTSDFTSVNITLVSYAENTIRGALTEAAGLCNRRVAARIRNP